MCGLVGMLSREDKPHLFVLPVTALDHSGCYLLLFLQPPALSGKKEVSALESVRNCPPNI